LCSELDMQIQEYASSLSDLALGVTFEKNGRPVSKKCQLTPSDMCNVDRTWSALVARHPGPHRNLVKALPYRLGITDRPDGGWHDYVHYEPLYDLPGFLTDLVAKGVPHSLLDRYRRAHHISGFYGLLIDRVADGQVQQDPALRADRAWLRKAWENSLVRATGRPGAARRWIAPALKNWRRGVQQEQLAIRNRRMEPCDYREIVVLKVNHLFVSAQAMMLCLEVEPRIRARAKEVFDLVLLALQCNDDATDAAEDTRVWGIGTPELLGIQPSALRRAGVHVLARASQMAKNEWPRMAKWCREVEERLAALVPPREALVAEIGARIIVPGLVL
jgi:hypothetical protein